MTLLLNRSRTWIDLGFASFGTDWRINIEAVRISESMHHKS